MAPGDADDDLDEPPFREPLPKDDRLWRHPSELEEAPRRSRWRRLRPPVAPPPAGEIDR